MELYYQIALKSVPFDNSYKNVLRFDTRSEQEAYFETNTLFSNSPNVNFNVGSLYATNVIYDGIEENINELLNHNYCIIKDNRPNAQLKFYYYFVTNAMQDCDNRIKLSLELDIFQTYYIDLSFGDSIIFKAHLDRFIENGDGTVSFDGTPESKLFEREDIKNVAKRMIKRTRINLYNTGHQDLDQWLNENIAFWVYAFVDRYHPFNFKNIVDGSEINRSLGIEYGNFAETETSGKTTVISQLGCVCIPVFKTLKNLTISATDTTGQNKRLKLEKTSLEKFFALNNGNAYVYSVKISDIPPFTSYNTEYSITTTGLEINGYYSIQTDQREQMTGFGQKYLCVNYSSDPTQNFGIINITNQELKMINLLTQNYELEDKLTFTKEEIINSNKNAKFNPKLLSSDYKTLSICDALSNGFDYDIQKLNKQSFQLKYTEALTAGITKKYIRINETKGVYIKECEENLTGFVSQNDNSLDLATTAYQSMLANNKNYFIQNDINRRFALQQGLLNTGKNLIGGLMDEDADSRQLTLNTTTDLIRLRMNYQQSIINENLTVGNMRNAPSSVNLAKGDAVFDIMFTESGIYVEEYDILPNEKEMINDYMCLYGFTYNRVDNVKNVDNIRKIYNYVRADIETINGANISETVHQKFRKCFANGVRFWNTDTFSYEKENYERWLENE